MWGLFRQFREIDLKGHVFSHKGAKTRGPSHDHIMVFPKRRPFGLRVRGVVKQESSKRSGQTGVVKEEGRALSEEHLEREAVHLLERFPKVKREAATSGVTRGTSTGWISFP